MLGCGKRLRFWPTRSSPGASHSAATREAWSPIAAISVATNKVLPRLISLRGDHFLARTLTLLFRRSSWWMQRESTYSQGWCVGWWRSAWRASAAACCASVGQEGRLQLRLESRGSVLRQRRAAASKVRPGVQLGNQLSAALNVTQVQTPTRRPGHLECRGDAR